MEWFSQRRLSQLLQKEEKRKASLDAAKSGAVAVEATVVRIVDACAGKDVARTICKGTSERSRRVAARTTWCAALRHGRVHHCLLRARRGGQKPKTEMYRIHRTYKKPRGRAMQRRVQVGHICPWLISDHPPLTSPITRGARSTPHCQLPALPYALCRSNAQRQSPPPPASPPQARISGASAAAKAAAQFLADIPMHAGSTPPVSLFLKVTQKRQSAFSGLAVSAGVRRFFTLRSWGSLTAPRRNRGSLALLLTCAKIHRGDIVALNRGRGGGPHPLCCMR